MLLDTLTIVGDEGAPIVLGSWKVDRNGWYGYFLDKLDIGAPEYTANVVARASGPGTHKRRPKASGRYVKVQGSLIGRDRGEANQLGRDLIRLVARFNRPEYQVRLRYLRGATTVELLGKIVNKPDLMAANLDGGKVMQEFDLAFLCEDPRAFELATRNATVSGSTPVANPGDDTWPTLTIKGTGGTVTAFTVSDSQGNSLSLSGLSLASGQSITVVCQPGLESIEMSDGTQLFDKLSDPSRFVVISHGGGTLAFSATGGSASCTASYRVGYAD